MPPTYSAPGASVCSFRFLRSLDPGSIGRWRHLRVADNGRGQLGATASEPTIIYDIRGRVVAKFTSPVVCQLAPPELCGGFPGVARF